MDQSARPKAPIGSAETNAVDDGPCRLYGKHSAKARSAGERLILLIALLEIASIIVYVIPRTTILGAILITGYLGGATAANVRVGDPSFVVRISGRNSEVALVGRGSGAAPGFIEILLSTIGRPDRIAPITVNRCAFAGQRRKPASAKCVYVRSKMRSLKKTTAPQKRGAYAAAAHSHSLFAIRT